MKKSFYDLNLRSFGDGFCNEDFSVDENMILASIIYLSQISGGNVDKDELHFFADSFGGYDLRDEHFEDALTTLQKEGFIETFEEYVTMTKKLYDCIEEKYGQLIV